MKELERLNEGIEKIEDKVNNIDRKLVKLETKATIWGGIAGAVIATISALVSKLF